MSPQRTVSVITGPGGSVGHGSALAFSRDGALVGCTPSVDAGEAAVEALYAGGIGRGMALRGVPS